MTNISPKTFSEISHSIFDPSAFKIITAIFLYLFNYLFKTQDTFLGIVAPIALIAFLDTATGIFYAVKSKQLDSEKYSKIGAKAFTYSVYIIMGRIIDAEISSVKLPIFDIHLPSDWATTAFKILIISAESLSILENAAKLGFPVPERIRKYLKAFTDDGKEIKK